MIGKPRPRWQLPRGVTRSLWEYAQADHIARDYDEYFAYNRLFDFDQEVLDRHFSTPGLVVDLGCGFGKSTLPFAVAFPDAQVTGLDLSAPCLELAASDAAAAKVPNVHFRQADACATGLAAGAFDLVTSTMLLHELPPPELKAIFAETYRLLAPGALAIHLDFRTDDPFWQFMMYGHGVRNNEPFLAPQMRTDLVALHHEVGFETVQIEPFAERDGATDPGNPYWRFPWAAIIARKPATQTTN